MLAAVLFYYELKRLTVEGYFGGQRYVEFIRRRTGLSVASIYRGFTSLAEAGLARREAGKIWLVRYDVLFERLGIQVGGEKGARLLKVASSGHVEDNWQTAEIELNLNVQHAVSERNYVYTQKEFRNTDKAPQKKLFNRIARGFKRADWLSSQLRDILEKPRVKVNCDVTLTCQKVAELFGYKSATAGHKIEHRLRERGKLTVQNRFLLIRESITPAEFFGLRLQDSSFFVKRGQLVKQLPNLLRVAGSTMP
jgi:hypothetical protein